MSRAAPAGYVLKLQEVVQLAGMRGWFGGTSCQAKFLQLAFPRMFLTEYAFTWCVRTAAEQP